jgi:gentisate 1,2-dioxygenase
MPHDSTMRDAEARRSLKADLARLNCRVHQPDDPALFTREPRSTMKPVHWRWKDLEPLLARIGEEIEIGSGGQRRTLRLGNPGFPYGTTHTFWASIQVILPGEIAVAHRHTANAFRFIMKGSGATTTVDGERFVMNEGDLVLTPAWTWHDHEYHGKAPMIWLDVLDISLMHSMHATFFEPYPTQVQNVLSEPKESPLADPFPRAKAQLEHTDSVEYPGMATLAMKLHKLRPQHGGKAQRHTGSKLYYIFRGSGASMVEGQRYEWSAGDFLAVPPWAWHEHSSKEKSLLFEVNDTPAMKALGYYREETK